MSSIQKAALSFLSALVLFAGFVFFAQTGLMAQIETKFYAQTKINEKDDQLEKLSQRCNSYISDILSIIQTGDDAYLKQSAIKTFVHQNPSEKEATDRKNLTARLFDELEEYGLDGLRLIEKNGRTLHYSSYEDDVLKRVSLNTTYKLYSDIVKDSSELDGELLLVDADKPETKMMLDKTNDRLVISFPFYVTDNTYFATLVAYFDLHFFEKLMINERIINLGDSFATVTADDSYQGGFVLGLPKNSQSEFYAPVLKAWTQLGRSQNHEISLERILEKDDGSYWLLLTSPQSKYFNISAVYSSTLFELPRELKYLIYASVFITLLLVAALLFNLKRDYLSVIKSRIKKVQFGIINEYLENKEKIEWTQVAKQLENRKAELSEEIKKSVGGKTKKYSDQVDAYLDSSWEDILSLLKAQNVGNAAASGVVGNGATIEEIRRVIEDVLRTSKVNVNVAPAAKASKPAPVEEVEEIEEVEEVEDIEEADAVEEIEEIEDAEEIEEIDEAEPIEEIEEVEEVEEIEEIDEAEPIEEIEEVEEIDEAEPVEEIEEVEEVEPVEEVEEVEEIEEAEPVEEVEEVEEAEPVEEVEEVEEIPEPVEEPEEIEEPIEEVEEVEEIEEAEPVEEIEELEELEEYNSEPPTFGEVDSHYSVSNDDPRFHEEFHVGELTPQGVPLEYSNEPEPLDYTFTVEVPKFTIEELLEELDTDSGEETPVRSKSYFSMTSFAQNDEPVIELKGEGDDSENQNAETIVEQDGVYSISENLSYANVSLNEDFKSLVDSVLQK